MQFADAIFSPAVCTLNYILILVCLGDFGQIPGPNPVLFWRVLLLLLLLRFPRTPPLFFPAQQKKGGTAARAARARRARKKHTSPPTIS
jgi:hypothetical protein